MNLNDPAIETPCLVVDRARVLRNIARLREKVGGADVVLRPHLKTVKSIDAARLVMTSPQGPAAISTLKEAEEFGRHGVTDLLYAVGIAPQKLDRVVRISQSGVDLAIVTDNIEAAKAIVATATSYEQLIPTLIEIDVDGHRSGIKVGDDMSLVAVASILHEAGCLRGVMTHAGGSYGLTEQAALEAAADNERTGIVQAAELLRTNNLPCDVVSIGSTPTVFSSRDLSGITEIRAGVFQFFDLYQAGVGVCAVKDIALSVLTTVIGHQRERQWTIIDSGWMALSSDRGTASQPVDQYYGLVCDVRGEPIGDLVVLKVNQEHGVVAVRPGSGSAPMELPVGTRLRVLPNHACATAAQHNKYEIVEACMEVTETWPRFGGW